MQDYIRWVLRHRLIIVGIVVAITAGLFPQAQRLRIVIDPNTMLPRSDPYVVTTNKIADVFGSRYVMVIGITAKHGDVFEAGILNKVERITAGLLRTRGVVTENVTSLAARKIRDIKGSGDSLEVSPLMAHVPENTSQMQALRMAVERNPVYKNLLISSDQRTVAIYADIRNSRSGFSGTVSRIMSVVNRERDATVDVAVGGLPVYLAHIEEYSNRVFYLFPAAILIIALLNFEAFRTIQGMLLPLVTALLATGWDMGIMGIAGIPFDVVNVTTPVVVLAVSAGHAVQLLKRYYEQYYHLRDTTSLSPSEANTAAVVQSLVRVGPVMLIAGSVASLGFFSLVVTTIPSVRTLGIIAGIGILCALILEMTFIPALRSLLPPPSDEERRREQHLRIWDRITGAIAKWVTGSHRYRLYWLTVLVLAISAFGATQVVMDNTVRGYFSKNLNFQKDDRELNRALGGTNTLYLLVEGSKDDAIKNPAVLRAMEATQHFLEQQPSVGKTLSIVDFIKRMNQVMHNNDPAYDRIPGNAALVSQYLLLYSMEGQPSDFDAYVDYPYRSAIITAYLKNDSSAYLIRLVAGINRFAATQFGKDISLKVGGSAPENAALNEVLVHGKILNVIQIGSVIFIITSIVFRSLLGGLLVAVPLFITVMVNFGLMGLCGIKLNIPTSICFAMVVGIGADYSIYLIYRMREQIRQGVNEMSAIHNVLGTAGKACLYVAAAVAAGYSVFLFSFGFYVHIWMGILTITAMATSVFSALTLIPALILTLRPRFIFGQDRNGQGPALAVITVSIAALGLFIATPRTVGAADLTANEIMNKNAVSLKVGDSTSDATLTLAQKSGQERVRKIVSITKLERDGKDNMRMTRFLWPPDVKGTATLLVEHSGREDDMWVYLPALSKVRRLVSSNKRDSFMGTDFSYGDVIGYRVGEWKNRLLRQETLDGHACYVIESTPKSASVESSSGYSRRVSWIRQDNNVTVKEQTWDEAGELLKIMTFDKIRLVDSVHDKWQPMELKAVNQQTGHRTIIAVSNFKANRGLKDEEFTTRYLERGL